MRKVFKLTGDSATNTNLASNNTHKTESEELPESEQKPSDEQTHAAQMLKINLLVLKYSDVPESQLQAKKDIIDLYQKLNSKQKEFLIQSQPEIAEVMQENDRLLDKQKAKTVIKPALSNEQQLAYANCSLDFLTAKQSFDSGTTNQNQTHINAIEAFTSNLQLLPAEQQHKIINELLLKRWDSLAEQLSEARIEKKSESRQEYITLIKQRLQELDAFSRSILLACHQPDSPISTYFGGEFEAKLIEMQNNLDKLENGDLAL